MAEIDLSSYHFTDWPEEYIDELRNKLKENAAANNITTIQRTAVTGTRVYIICGLKNFFTASSDLDIVHVISEDEYNDKIASGEFTTEFKLTGFDFYNVHVSPQCRTTFDFTFLGTLKLPRIDLDTLEYYPMDELDLLDYLVNVKNRIENDNVCYFCQTLKPSPYILKLEAYNRELFDLGNLLTRFSNIYICEDCYNKYVKDLGLKAFIESNIKINI